ncbi:MAG: hypothetical protein ACR2QM_13610 [Longimicrobiales bacterium]
MDEPRFTDEQARQIFEVAAAAQESSATSLVHADRGYTLAELQDIASEVGIDPVHVSTAASSVMIRGSDATPYLRWAGVPGEVDVQGIVNSEITDQEWEYMVLELRDHFNKNGLSSQFGEVREWASSNNLEGESTVRVRVDSRGDTTAIRLSQSLKVYDQLILGLGGSLGGVGVVLGMTGFFGPAALNPLPIAAVFLGIGASFGAIFRIHAKLFFKRQRRQFKVVLEQLMAIARQDDKLPTPSDALPPGTSEPGE